MGLYTAFLIGIILTLTIIIGILIIIFIEDLL